MNRIRELRDVAGLSSDELGRLAGISGSTIRKLERGEQRLTVDLLTAIAQVLEVSPAELGGIETGIMESDVEPHTMKPAAVAESLRRRGLTAYRVLRDSVIDSGVAVGDIITVDESPQAIASAVTGDIVLVETIDDDLLLLMVLVRPQLVVSNRPGYNYAVRLDGRSFRLRLRGVLVAS